MKGLKGAFNERLTVSPEQSNTPVVDTQGAVMNDIREYAFFTMPSTSRFFIITGLEWKNHTTIDGNVFCGVDLVDADPPVDADVQVLVWSSAIAQSGSGVIQRNSAVVSLPIREGTVIGAWINSDSATATLRRIPSQSSQNQSKSIATATPVFTEATAWSAETERFYLKIYFRGYS